MKERILTIIMYSLLAFIRLVYIAGYTFSGLLTGFGGGSIITDYCSGILIYIFSVIWVISLGLPILKRKKFKKKWILPMVLTLVLLIVPIFNDGLIKRVEDDLSIFSKEKWDKYESLRIYMLDDLDTNYIWKGADEEYVIKLLGEPFYIKEENPRYIEYYVSSGNLDPIRFYIMFEDGKVIETGKHHT